MTRRSPPSSRRSLATPPNSASKSTTTRLRPSTRRPAIVAINVRSAASPPRPWRLSRQTCRPYPAESMSRRMRSARRPARTFGPHIPPSRIRPEPLPSQSDGHPPRAFRRVLAFLQTRETPMPTPRIRSTAGALAGAAAALWLTPALPHAVCGDRIFPATLAIDDPGVTDELALPTLEWLPQNSDGVGEFDANFSWSKTIFSNLAVSVGAGPTWLHTPSGYGWDALDTEAKYQFFCIPQLEFMGSVGFDVSWGGSATGAATGSA